MSGKQSHSRKERELRVWSGQKDSDKRQGKCQAMGLNVQSCWEDYKPQHSRERARPLSERWSETVSARCRDARGGSRCNRKNCTRHWKWWKISQINPEPVSVFPDYVLLPGFNVFHIFYPGVFHLFGNLAGFILTMVPCPRKWLMPLIDKESSKFRPINFCRMVRRIQ